MPGWQYGTSVVAINGNANFRSVHESGQESFGETWIATDYIHHASRLLIGHGCIQTVVVNEMKLGKISCVVRVVTKRLLLGAYLFEFVYDSFRVSIVVRTPNTR
jgi:hypothetical protein